MSWRLFFRILTAGFFVVAGANHFRAPAVYLGMLPHGMPAPLTLIYISGAAEILGGIGLCIPVVRKFSGWGLIVLLVAVFPANLHVAFQARMTGFDFLPLVLWLRLPLQLAAIAWVWWIAVAPLRNETLD